MASHHHHRTTTTSCSACSCSHCYQPPPLAPPHPQPQQSDPLLQALASLLLQSQSQSQSQTQTQQNHYLNQTHCLKSFQDQNFANKRHHFHYQRQQQHHQEEEPNFLLLSSLVSRINALESSLQHFSKASNPSLFTLKDEAARVIQTHFRAFLVHRSRTLRQLKDLAFIKSSLDSLKLSVLNKTRFDHVAVSQKAMNLLLKLDSFQGGDQMIRDGKRSVSRDLSQFLEYIHGLALNRKKHLSLNAKNVRVWGSGGKARILRSNYGETMEKLRDRVENLERFSINEERDDDDDDNVELEGFHQVIGERQNPRISIAGKAVASATQNRHGNVLVKRQGIQSKVKKTVSFAENGNVYRIVRSGNELSTSGDGSLTDDSVSDDHGEVMENIVIEENEGLVENEKEMNLDNNEESTYDYQIQDGDFMFSAPLPVKMESKADLMKNRKGSLHIVS